MSFAASKAANARLPSAGMWRAWRCSSRTHPDRIALLGARPERPETGYGYIAVGHRVVGPGEAFRVVAFHEKPAPALAARIIGRGGSGTRS